MTMTLIETKTLGTAASSIEFTSIPQDGTDLYVLISARSTNSDPGGNCKVIPNGWTSGYSARALYGTGSSAASYTTTDLGYSGEMNGNTATSNTFSNIAVYYPNYTASVNKSVSVDNVIENNATASRLDIVAGLWTNTAAITSLAITSNASTNLVAGSTISLYKITKGSGGATVS